MKRIISAMLAVLLCVLVLGGCEEVNHENLSTESESSASPSTEESDCSGEAEDGAASGEGESPFLFADGYSAVLLKSNRSVSAAIDNNEKIFAISTGENGSFLQVFDAKSGELLSEADYSDFGEIMRIEAYSQKAGFDYRICLGDRIIYLSFDDFNKSFEEILPNNISFKINFDNGTLGKYDITETAFAYENGDAIRLELANRAYDILPENHFASVSNFLNAADEPDPDGFSGNIYFGNPRFICNGEKLVIGVFSQMDYEYIGCTVYDIAEENFIKSLYCAVPQKPVYPILDRYIYIPPKATLTDAEADIKIRVDSDEDAFVSFDYRTLVAYSFERDKTSGYDKDVTAYLVDIQTDDKRLFFILKQGYSMYLDCFSVTENYILVSAVGFGEDYYYAIKYTE